MHYGFVIFLFLFNCSPYLSQESASVVAHDIKKAVEEIDGAYQELEDIFEELEDTFQELGDAKDIEDIFSKKERDRIKANIINAINKALHALEYTTNYINIPSKYKKMTLSNMQIARDTIQEIEDAFDYYGDVEGGVVDSANSGKAKYSPNVQHRLHNSLRERLNKATENITLNVKKVSDAITAANDAVKYSVNDAIGGPKATCPKFSSFTSCVEREFIHSTCDLINDAKYGEKILNYCNNQVYGDLILSPSEQGACSEILERWMSSLPDHEWVRDKKEKQCGRLL